MGSKFQHYSSHVPLLLYALSATSGDVLELGTGLFSTPLLHYWCVPRNRTVISVENHLKWYDKMLAFEHEYHRILFTANWEMPELEREFDVVFLDHAPMLQRRLDLRKYADLAKYIVVHDTNGRTDKHYKIRDEWQNFKHVRHDGRFYPQTTIVSNFEEIRIVD